MCDHVAAGLWFLNGYNAKAEIHAKRAVAAGLWFLNGYNPLFQLPYTDGVAAGLWFLNGYNMPPVSPAPGVLRLDCGF